MRKHRLKSIEQLTQNNFWQALLQGAGAAASSQVGQQAAAGALQGVNPGGQSQSPGGVAPGQSNFVPTGLPQVQFTDPAQAAGMYEGMPSGFGQLLQQQMGTGEGMILSRLLQSGAPQNL